MIIEKGKGRRYAIPDIHGCLKTFRALLNKIRFSKKDQLFLLGDYIDRGPDSAGVIDAIIGMIKNGYQVYPLRGNHEQDFLDASREYDYLTLMFYARKMNSLDLLDANHKLKPNYKSFIENLPYYFELDNYYLVHGGFNTLKQPFKDYIGMMQIRNMTYHPDIYKEKTIVFGHHPRELTAIENATYSNSKLLPLDNGCVYVKRHKIFDVTQLGNLLAFDLDKQKLHIQHNIDILA